MYIMDRINHIHGIYRYACPNCGGENDDLRLAYKAPCSKCLSEDRFRKIEKEFNKLTYEALVSKYYELLKKNNTLRNYLELYDMINKVGDFEKFFNKITGGFKLWSAQRTWAMRLLKNRSFSIVAPTGMGKTMFSLAVSLYLLKNDHRVREGEKIYLVFPTTPLLIQAYNKLLKLAEKSDIKICGEEELGNRDCSTIIAFHGKLGKGKREQYTRIIEEGRFNILLSTNMFMHKHSEKLLGKRYRLIVMDDVDAILRSGKAIRTLFKIIGLTDEEIDQSINYLKIRQRSPQRSSEERESIGEEFKKLENRIREIRGKINTLVIVSSATGKPRGVYPKLFKILLGFEVGSKAEGIRNIVDTYLYPREDVESALIDLVKKLGDGGLIFVTIDRGVEYADKLAELLRNQGLRAEAFYGGKPLTILDKYAGGELDILVGVATYYGVMVRGLDLPDRVKYAVFVGVPRHKFSSKLEKPSPTDILRILTILRDVLDGDEKREVEMLIGRLSSRYRRLSQGALSKLREDLFKKLSGEEVEPYPLLDLTINALEKARALLSRPEVWDKLRSLGDIGLVRENGRDYILIPDTATYIQASGRTSRLYPGGVTKGLSIVIVDDQRLLNGLIKRMKWIFEDFNMRNIEESDLEKLMKEISEERSRVKKILAGEIEVDKAVELTKSALLIVESPNKARTIANFFGKPSTRVVGDRLMVYDVAIGRYVLSIVASIGHVYDLVVDRGYRNYGVEEHDGLFIPIYTDIKKCVKCGYQFTEEREDCPKCGSREIFRKIDIINMLRDIATEVDTVFIGTDPDTEGEKIGWDLKVLLEPYAREVKRIEFHEVTRRAILEAIMNPRDFDMKLVEAQIVRRVEDRWMGFALSQIVQRYFWREHCLTQFDKMKKRLDDIINRLSKKQIKLPKREMKGLHKLVDRIRKDMNRMEKQLCCKENRNLSAGRVQTPVLGYIVDRFRERYDRDKYRYIVYVKIDGQPIPIEVDRKIYTEIKEGKAEKYVNIVEKERVIDTVNPPPPFTTDTLLEEASQKLKLSTTRIMELAQDLFELGLITYHRTDSTRVSEVGIGIAKAYLDEKYGALSEQYFRRRPWGAGGAHEAIRPTKPIDPDRLSELVKEGVLMLVKPLTRSHYELYRLIFERFIASQMTSARVEKQKLVAEINGFSREMERVINIIEKGFLDIYREYIVPENPVKPGKYVVDRIVELPPPLPRFHEVIRWMKTQGIGRPSTYAKIVQTLLDRRYVEVTKKQKALYPKDRGKLVYYNLMKYYGDIVNIEATRELEKKMKMIEDGEADYQQVLREIYDELRSKIIENHDVNDMLERLWREYCGGE